MPEWGSAEGSVVFNTLPMASTDIFNSLGIDTARSPHFTTVQDDSLQRFAVRLGLGNNRPHQLRPLIASDAVVAKAHGNAVVATRNTNDAFGPDYRGRSGDQPRSLDSGSF